MLRPIFEVKKSPTFPLCGDEVKPAEGLTLTSRRALISVVLLRLTTSGQCLKVHLIIKADIMQLWPLHKPIYTFQG